MARPGRRQGDSDTRGEIVAAARAEFLEHGYTAATIRSVARRAEVDPALIYHYFTDKATLYASTLDLPADPRQIMNEVGMSTTSPGGRLVEGFLAQWESGPGEPGRSFVTMIQAMSSSPEAARSLREFLVDRVWARLAEQDEEARWRVAMVSSQLIGLGWSRYVVRAEPLASAPRHEVAERVAPMLERLMFGGAPPGAQPGAAPGAPVSSAPDG
jgi:AcrR family transcriptional regulator